ncbi:hypothetical protein ACIBTV_27760 [Micromonospora sp. NPDC049366]|uniref:hypothetical protein n=1 Tax=Micromonospora sp. NPDC049366 TaxID=3364271 RepID=UPI0037BC7147
MGTPMMVRVITAGMLVYALIIGGLFVGYVRVQSCLADYSDQAANRTSEIAAATTRSSQAQIEGLDALIGAGDADDVRTAIVKWRDTLVEYEQLRAQNPPPPSPAETCS